MLEGEKPMKLEVGGDIERNIVKEENTCVEEVKEEADAEINSLTVAAELPATEGGNQYPLV